MRTFSCIAFILTFAVVGFAQEEPKLPEASLTLIPPSPVTEQIKIDIRAALRNDSDVIRTFDVALFLDKEQPEKTLLRKSVEVAAHSASGVRHLWTAKRQGGEHRLLLVAKSGDRTIKAEQPLRIVASQSRSMRRLGGAWVDIYHHDPAEGRPFDEELGKMTEPQWRELVRAMHEVEQDIIVVTMLFQNFTHRGRHKIESEGYQGKAYYPSKWFPGRMPIACQDPLEAILSEADKLGMHVFPGIGMYAFFDFTPGSLTWHKRVANEVWERYGHHRSFYGWYVSEEKDGGLGNDEERQELVAFFREFLRVREAVGTG